MAKGAREDEEGPGSENKGQNKGLELKRKGKTRKEKPVWAAKGRSKSIRPKETETRKQCKITEIRARDRRLGRAGGRVSVYSHIRE